MFGPVQRAILVEQFHRIFFGAAGDWWEDRLEDIGGFEDEVHATTIGSVINDNTRSFVQPNAFKLGGGGGKTGAPPPYSRNSWNGPSQPITVCSECVCVLIADIGWHSGQVRYLHSCAVMFRLLRANCPVKLVVASTWTLPCPVGLAS